MMIRRVFGWRQLAVAVGLVIVTGCGSQGQRSAGTAAAVALDTPVDGGSTATASSPPCHPFAPVTLSLPPDAMSECVLDSVSAACESSSDCRMYFDQACTVVCTAREIVGVNRAFVCPAPSCPAPPPSSCGGQPFAGFIGQDCTIVPSLDQVGVGCISGQCMTFAIDAGVAEIDATAPDARGASADGAVN
jgi:hypothetical protein